MMAWRWFRRRPEAGPGHQRVHVWCDQDPISEKWRALHPNGFVQCATEERIPFGVPPERFRANYEAEEP